MEVFELLKYLIEKLKVTYIFIACLITALIAKFISTDKVWLIISFCSTYLIVEFIVWLYGKILSSSQIRKEKREEEKRKYAEEKSNEELIWQHFISLSDRTLQVAEDIYHAKMPDKSSPLIRLLPEREDFLFLVFASYKNPFDIQLGNRYYIPCISGESKDNNILVIFNRYFYLLLENYIKTGRKEKV